MNQRNSKFYFLSVIVGVAVLSLLFTSNTFASVAGGGAGLPYEAWLVTLRNSVTGPVAFTFGLIGIVVAGGVLIFGGELNAFFRTMMFIVLVMALLVAANNLMTTLFSGAVIPAVETTETTEKSDIHESLLIEHLKY